MESACFQYCQSSNSQNIVPILDPLRYLLVDPLLEALPFLLIVFLVDVVLGVVVAGAGLVSGIVTALIGVALIPTFAVLAIIVSLSIQMSL